MLLIDDYPRYFDRQTVVVAASGSGLTTAVAEQVRASSVATIVVNDAVFLMPWANVLYAADGAWWSHHCGVPDFKGKRWSVLDPIEAYRPAKLQLAVDHDISLLLPAQVDEFSHDRTVLTLGRNSGLQAINLAMHFGAARIVLVGFNMKGTHYFGSHPLPLRNSDPESFIKHFDMAAGTQGSVDIYNATPDSALKCFPQVDLGQVI